jgi:hypothetical protein
LPLFMNVLEVWSSRMFISRILHSPGPSLGENWLSAPIRYLQGDRKVLGCE